MRRIILDSVRINEGEALPYDPFELLDRAQPGPQIFELSYLEDDGRTVRYGFKNTREAIEAEWLFVSATPGEPEQPLFLRDSEGTGISDKLFPEGDGLESKVNTNRLFLSLCGQLGGHISNSVISFFIHTLKIISGVSTFGYSSFTRQEFLEHTPVASKALEFMRRVQLGFEDVFVREIPRATDDEEDEGSRSEKRRQPLFNRTYSVHKIYDPDGNEAGKRAFLFDRFESDGTQKIFSISGPFFDVLTRGAVLVVDEMDAKLHPLLSQALVRLFTSEETNPHGAQLLFTTHDTRLLADDLLTPSQIWFAEKDALEATDLYRLSDITMPDGSELPRHQNVEQNYINGRYGAIPYFKY